MAPALGPGSLSPHSLVYTTSNCFNVGMNLHCCTSTMKLIHYNSVVQPSGKHNDVKTVMVPSMLDVEAHLTLYTNM